MALSGMESAKHARRFVKFCIVGASSTLIQMVTMKAVEVAMHSQSDVAAQLGNGAGAILAIANGFYWNRRWTYRLHGEPGAHSQFARFFGVSLVGLLLNWSIFHIFLVRLGLFRGFAHADILNQLLTISCVVVWNFTANTLWTFRAPDAD
ncbi:MAG TPA: GtrA family protein [Armatimonadota bacterium]|jgi:putative flippase GtrA